MNIKHLGNGAAFCPERDNTAAYFVIEKSLFLIDCGESNFSRIAEKKLFDGINEIIVIITHMHADHIGSLASLISYAKIVKKIPVTVVHPVDSIVRVLDLMGINRDNYYFHQTNKYKHSRFSVDFIRVEHAQNMECFGLLISDEVESIYYSGDAANIPENVLEKFLSNKICRLYQDTGNVPSTSHMYYKELEKLIPKIRRHDVYCMHLVVWEEEGTYIEELRNSGFSIVEVD